MMDDGMVDDGTADDTAAPADATEEAEGETF